MSNVFRRYYVCVYPTTLKLEEELSKTPPNFRCFMDNPDKVRSGLYYIIDLVTSKSYKKSIRGTKCTQSVEVFLCSELLRPVVTYYNEYISYLISIGVIQQVKKGVKGKFCSSYKLCEKYVGYGVKIFKIVDQKIILSIYQGNKHEEAIARYSELYKDLTLLTVDWLTAYEILDRLNLSPESHAKQLKILHRIEDPIIGTFKRGRTGRLTTTLTNLKKELRVALRYKGQPLVAYDLKNSIPFFTLAFLNKKAFEEHNLLDLILKVNPLLSEVKNKERKTHTIMLQELASQITIYEDLDHYKQLVLSGDIYEEVMMVWNNSPATNTKYTRETAKKMLLKILNAQTYVKSPEKKILIEMFPAVIPAFLELNKGFTKSRHGAGNAKWKPGDPVAGFAHVTQLLEAKIILDRICAKLKVDHPYIPLYTLHDSIFTIEKYAGVLKSYMEEIILAEIGFMPTVVLEKRWGILKETMPAETLRKRA